MGNRNSRDVNRRGWLLPGFVKEYIQRMGQKARGLDGPDDDAEFFSVYRSQANFLGGRFTRCIIC